MWGWTEGGASVLHYKSLKIKLHSECERYGVMSPF